MGSGSPNIIYTSNPIIGLESHPFRKKVQHPTMQKDIHFQPKGISRFENTYYCAKNASKEMKFEINER